MIRWAFGFAVLVGFDAIGQVAHHWLHVPLPGALIGMFLLAACLVFYERGGAAEAAFDGGRQAEAGKYRGTAVGAIYDVARVFTTHMSLFFIPAGVGVVAWLPVLRSHWLPVTAALALSTWLALFATAAVAEALLGRDSA